jgi:hypothetical protein
MVKGIRDSRAKDYENPFRKMVYQSDTEMEKVIGKLSENSFIKQEQNALKKYKNEVAEVIKKLKLDKKAVV